MQVCNKHTDVFLHNKSPAEQIIKATLLVNGRTLRHWRVHNCRSTTNHHQSKHSHPIGAPSPRWATVELPESFPFLMLVVCSCDRYKFAASHTTRVGVWLETWSSKCNRYVLRIDFYRLSRTRPTTVPSLQSLSSGVFVLLYQNTHPQPPPHPHTHVQTHIVTKWSLYPRRCITSSAQILRSDSEWVSEWGITCTGTDNLTRTTNRQNTQITQQNATQRKEWPYYSTLTA